MNYGLAFLSRDGQDVRDKAHLRCHLPHEQLTNIARSCSTIHVKRYRGKLARNGNNLGSTFQELCVVLTVFQCEVAFAERHHRNLLDVNHARCTPTSLRPPDALQTWHLQRHPSKLILIASLDFVGQLRHRPWTAICPLDIRTDRRCVAKWSGRQCK